MATLTTWDILRWLTIAELKKACLGNFPFLLAHDIHKGFSDNTNIDNLNYILTIFTTVERQILVSASAF